MNRAQTEPQMAAYLHARGRRLGLPIAGNFELTARCNFRCPMCYVHQEGQQERELTTGQWIDLARQAAEQGMVFALLTGGEPFLRKDFFEIYRAMKDMGILVSINSNGSLLSGEIRERLLAEPPQRMNISLYGGCRETYRSMCGSDAFDRVVENIRALKEAGVDVSLNLSITPFNRQDLQKIYAISRELEVPVRASSYMYPPVRLDGCARRLSPAEAAQCTVQWDLLRFSPEEFALRAEAVANLRAVEPKTCGADPERSIGCRAGSSSFWLTWDGRMLPCGMMPFPETRPLDRGFRAAWEELRQQTAAIRTPAECTACPSRELCPVCAAVCVAETGAFDRVPEYVCRQTRHTIEQTLHAHGERSKK